jgi:hypothetical protein
MEDSRLTRYAAGPVLIVFLQATMIGERLIGLIAGSLLKESLTMRSIEGMASQESGHTLKER